MEKTYITGGSDDLARLCRIVREYVNEGSYEKCMEPIKEAMKIYPDAPHPHNLMGIVLEKTGDHKSAMRHFRAAWALEPTYLPARHNLETYGTFFSTGRCAFDESDVPRQETEQPDVEYDNRGVGRVVYKTKIVYDENGIGRAVRR